MDPASATQPSLVLSTDRRTAGAGDPQPIRSGLRGRASASETGPLTETPNQGKRSKFVVR